MTEPSAIIPVFRATRRLEVDGHVFEAGDDITIELSLESIEQLVPLGAIEPFDDDPAEPDDEGPGDEGATDPGVNDQASGGTGGATGPVGVPGTPAAAPAPPGAPRAKKKTAA